MTTLNGASVAFSPDWYRGELGEWDGAICDYITEDEACDHAAKYLVQWVQVPQDNGTTPISGACVLHAALVDRQQIERIYTPSQKTDSPEGLS